MKIREQAIQWWNKLDLGVPHLLTQTYYKDRATSSLTGREIEEIWRKEIKTENQVPQNIYLNRLKEQYRQSKLLVVQDNFYLSGYEKAKKDYDAMRLFCLDTELLDFNSIELMEDEVNSSF